MGPVVPNVRTAVAGVFAVAVALAMSARSHPLPAPPIDVRCTFTNPSYAGDCVEKTTRTAKQKPADACQPILDCLNNTRCAASYCKATTIRQGWKLKKAE